MNILTETQILYIEDDTMLSELFKTIMESLGGQVDIAITGDDGLARHAMQPYDLIVIDYQLPGMSGIHVTRKLLLNDPDLPIIMVTGQGSEQVAAQAIDAGVCNYVIKGNPQTYTTILPAMISQALKKSIAHKKILQENIVLRDAIDGLNEGFVYFDADDRLVLANQKISKLYPLVADFFKPGVSYEKILRTGVAKGQWGPNPGHIDDNLVAEQWIQSRLAYHRNPVGTFDFFIHNNRTIRVEETSTPLGGITGVRTDITELKNALTKLQESKELFRVTIDAMPNSLTLKNRDGAYLLVNKTFAQWMDMDQTSIIGQTASNIFPGHKIRLLQNDQQVLNTGQTITGEISLKFQDGKTRDIYFNKSPVRSSTGEIFAICTFIDDITQRKVLENKLHHAQKMEAIGQLAGGIAHDFNNLMAVMIGNLEPVLTEMDRQSPMRQQVQITMDAIDKGAALTQQMLTFSRQHSLSPDTINANTLVSETLQFITSTLDDLINISVDLSDDNHLITIDKSMFGNALLNLIINARDAMLDGGMITIKTTFCELNQDIIEQNGKPVNGRFVLITITDTGCGIDDGIADRVLDPFFTTKDVGQGTGLGLSMVYGFIQQSSGHLGISSNKNQGTVISIYLPIVNDNRVDDQRPKHISDLDFKNNTILLVEDNDAVRLTVSNSLQSLGYNVILAEDGATALKILETKNKTIDLVFTDITMSDNLSGIELAHYVYIHYKNIKVLLTSGYPDRIRNHESFDQLGLELLPKPYKRQQLSDAISRSLHRLHTMKPANKSPL